MIALLPLWKCVEKLEASIGKYTADGKRGSRAAALPTNKCGAVDAPTLTLPEDRGGNLATSETRGVHSCDKRDYSLLAVSGGAGKRS